MYTNLLGKKLCKHYSPKKEIYTIEAVYIRDNYLRLLLVDDEGKFSEEHFPNQSYILVKDIETYR